LATKFYNILAIRDSCFFSCL